MTVSKGIPYPLGMTVTGEREINLAAVGRQKKEWGLVLYPKDGGDPIRLPFEAQHRIGDVFSMKISGIRSSDYTYRLFEGRKETLDPYARRVFGNEEWGQRPDPALFGGVGDKPFRWGDDAPLMTPLCDSLIYQLHVRGFTQHASSGVRHKGTFAGVAEKIPYLKSLGVTALELMPVYEFLEVEQEKKDAVLTMQEAVFRYREKMPPEGERTGEKARTRINYWGFKEGFYFAPKASYAAGEDPVSEFKRMVKKLHENGIEVILQFFFPRQIRQGLILEVVKFWVQEYHIDGVHLMGERIPVTLVATDPLLSHTKIFCAEFSCEEIYSSQKTPEYKNLARFSDDFMYDMRRFLKSDEDMIRGVLYQLKKNPKQTGVINFITNYEGFSLADLVSYERKHNEENGEQNRDGIGYNASWNCGAEGQTTKRSILKLREKQMRNAMLLLLFAQGTPMIVAGDEFCFSRGGNNNAWCQDNETNWLNWKLSASSRRFLNFVRAAVALRKAHPILHMPEELTMMDFIACGCPDLSYHGQEAWKVSYERICREVGVLYCGRYARIDRKTEDDFFYIAYNMHWEEKDMALPALPRSLCWEAVLDSASGYARSQEEETQPPVFNHEADRTVRVRERSILILKSRVKAGKKGKAK